MRPVQSNALSRTAATSAIGGAGTALSEGTPHTPERLEGRRGREPHRDIQGGPDRGAGLTRGAALLALVAVALVAGYSLGSGDDGPAGAPGGPAVPAASTEDSSSMDAAPSGG